MEIRTFTDIPVGALVRANRKYRRTEAKTQWAIKAKQTMVGGQERISLFWLEPMGDRHPPGFDLQCPDDMLFVSPSLKIVADMETSVFHPNSGDVIGQFWGLVIAGGPCFLGEAFADDGESRGRVICTLEGEITRTEDSRAVATSCATVPDWYVEPCEEPKLVPQRGHCDLPVSGGPLTK